MTSHKLSTYWTLWFHKVDDESWDLNSYVKLYEFNTVEQFLDVFNTIDNFTAGMFFVMREDIIPMWEDKRNKSGGFFSYKLSKKDAADIWKEVVGSMIGNTLTMTKDNADMITGVSISPKLENCIIKIWNNDNNKKSPKLIKTVGNWINSDNAFYKSSRRFF